MINIDWIRKLACAVSLLIAVSTTSTLAQTTVLKPSQGNAQLAKVDSKVAKADLHVVVKSGDTLTTIVKRELGSLDLWQQVVQINTLDAPDKLAPGDLIIIPWEMLQTRNYAKVIFLKGVVALQRNGNKEALRLKKGDRIYIGDTIRTGVEGFVSLSFKGESQVNIQPDSDVELKELECFDVKRACEIKLKTTTSDMKIDVDNVGFSLPTKFSIETPYATAAVRGTEFDFSTKNGNILGVTKGAVEISADEISSRVPFGKGALAGEGRSVGILFDLLKEPQFDDIPRISAQDQISWKPVAQAGKYSVVIASNESLSDVIRSFDTDGLAFTAPARTGRYFVSTRAVAANGIKGFHSVKRVDQVIIDNTVIAPEMEIELSGNTMTINLAGQVSSEIHIGNRLEVVDGREAVADFKSYDVRAGSTLELEVDPTKDIYLTNRAIVSTTTVSPYGNLYELKGRGN